jgi:Leucine rich repeat
LAKCNTTEGARSSDILFALAEISGASLLTTPPNFQYMAKTWIDQVDGLLVCPDDIGALQQRYVMALFYYSMAGVEWDRCRDEVSPRDAGSSPCDNSTRWLSPTHECDWYGVACTDNNVTGLKLVNNNLVGQLVRELFTITSMTEVSLSDNGIFGRIPAGIQDWSSLLFIDMDSNKLAGTIPDGLFMITTLEAIDLNDNSLTGSISESIFTLTNLAVLQLENNLLTGAAPGDAFANMTELVQVRIYNNDITGSLEPVCAQLAANRAINPLYVQFLSADCGKVMCSCCSQCF